MWHAHIPPSVLLANITHRTGKGIDVKVIAQWQGRQDGGKLILGTYSHVRNVYVEEMAKKLV